VLKYTVDPNKENAGLSAPNSSGFGDIVDESFYAPLKGQRKVASTPFKVLDAPALQDDFYLNVVDWSYGNVLSVGLASSVYLWNASTSKIIKLCNLGFADQVSSTAWNQRGTHVAIGTQNGCIELWDANKCKCIRKLGGHTGRVGSLAWNESILSSGSRDRHIA
jgi:cell division cycle 20-like protein 1 (cofactor of APC complex)